MISGAQIPARYYNDLAMRIMGQAKAAESIELWVGIPSFFADLAVRKDDVAKKIAAVHQKLLDIVKHFSLLISSAAAARLFYI